MKSALATLLIVTLASHASAADPDTNALQSIGAEVKQVGEVITELKADCDKFGEAEYRLIGQVTTLRSLSLSGRALTDRDLAALAGLTQLESILLNGTELSDDGYRYFAAFQQLKRLSLFHPSRDCKDFTGAGLAHLEDLPKLERLTFAGATAGDEAFEAVGQLTLLKEFSQWHNWESPDAIKHLLKLPNLTSLKIGQRLPGRGRSLTPSFDDATLATVAQMKSLERLDLQEARLSYEGLAQLSQLPNLRELRTKWVDTPPRDVERLRQLLAEEVKIDWEPLSDADRETFLSQKLKL